MPHSITIILQNINPKQGLDKISEPVVVTNNLKIDQTAAILLGVYMQVAGEYLKHHKATCQLCTDEKKCISFAEHMEVVELLGVTHEKYTNKYLMDNMFSGEKNG